MSFRIDDILRKDSPNRTDGVSSNYKSNDKYPLNYPKDSILEQTLISKSSQLHFNSYISSDPYLRIHPLGNFASNYLENYCNYVAEKVTSCPTILQRSKSWSTFIPSSYPLMLYPTFPPHYSKRKGGQVRFSANQTDALEKRFLSHKYLSPEDRRILADSLKLTDRQVKTWFQNRRAKWRRSNSMTSEESNIQKDNDDSDEEIPFKTGIHSIY